MGSWCDERAKTWPETLDPGDQEDRRPEEGSDLDQIVAAVASTGVNSSALVGVTLHRLEAAFVPGGCAESPVATIWRTSNPGFSGLWLLGNEKGPRQNNG